MHIWIRRTGVDVSELAVTELGIRTNLFLVVNQNCKTDDNHMWNTIIIVRPIEYKLYRESNVEYVLL